MMVSFCALQMSNTRATLARPAPGSIGYPHRLGMAGRRIAFRRQPGGELGGEVRSVRQDRLRLADAHAGVLPAGASSFLYCTARFASSDLAMSQDVLNLALPGGIELERAVGRIGEDGDFGGTLRAIERRIGRARQCSNSGK